MNISEANATATVLYWLANMDRFGPDDTIVTQALATLNDRAGAALKMRLLTDEELHRAVRPVLTEGAP